jgi:phage-related protein
MSVRAIEFYRSSSGHCPVEEFLDALTSKQVQKVAWVLQLIEDLPAVPGHYLQKLVGSEDIWEVRVQFGGNIFRLLGFFDGPRLIVLTNGFAKKTQKTPTHEIALAVRRKHEYQARRKG